MLKQKLEGFKIILASGSPRRKEYFEQLGLDFEIRLKKVKEEYPTNLKGAEISQFLAELKGKPFLSEIGPMELVITSDTIVWHEDRALGKPRDKEEAKKMLATLSGKWHEVITSVCINSIDGQETRSCITKVKFKKLEKYEIDHYINRYRPYDKAGGYGIQEWIGLIAIEEIRGSYTNVVGLPTELVYKMLCERTE